MSRLHEPNETERRQVEAMAGFGVPEADIAKVLNIAPKTLRKHYRTELDTGHVKANTRVAESLFKQAVNGNTTAAIFWLKTRARWKEATILEHAGADGGPLQVNIVRFSHPSAGK
jgi:hypothetical protein